ncbi:MAG: alpha/beta hydrolase, partial [Pseudomonadota bacterium]
MLICFALLFVLMFYKQGVPVSELQAQYMQPGSDFLTVEGVNVHYRVTGRDSAPVVVLLHGVASSLHTWNGWHQELSSDFKVISLDLPGFGLTGPFPQGTVYSFEKYIQVIDGLMQYLNVEKAHIAGNSFGGGLAWRYSLARPAKVDKLILLDAAGLADQVAHKLSDINIGFFLSTLPLIKRISWFVTPKFLVKASVRNVYADQSLVTNELVSRYYDLLTREGNRRAFSSILSLTRGSHANSDLIRQVAVPTFIMWGLKDRLHPLAEGEIF